MGIELIAARRWTVADHCLRGPGPKLHGLPWAAALALAAAGPVQSQPQPQPQAQAFADATVLADLSIEQLADIQVVSVSRRPQALQDAAASVYVIQADDIRRAGVTSLPEALRLAPTLEVARADAAQYAISARGFKDVLANKMLALQDGRTIYSPLFAGVFWDMQDAVLEDIERIEVISGPGGTLWGTNAVNGVINITTRPASQTQGLLATASAGSDDSGAVLRYGAPLSDAGHYRVYAKTFNRGHLQRADGSAASDDSRKVQAGWRADWPRAGGTFTVQGDMYSGQTGSAPAAPDTRVSGLNALARWSISAADGTASRLQAYYDRAQRSDPGLKDELETLDVEFQHGAPLGERQQLLWGAGYRAAVDRVATGPFVIFSPPEKPLRWSHVFVQDEVALRPNLKLALGSKWETNVYTGTEVLPSVRLSWAPRPQQLLWSALSRAVRAPSRIDKDFSVPVLNIAGGPNFQSEVSRVLEIGWRAQPLPVLSYSLTAFRHLHDQLRSGQPTAVPVTPTTPFEVSNMIGGTSQGMEGWAQWQPAPSWRLSAGFLTLRQDLHLEPGSLDPTGPSALGNDPNHQLMLRLAWNPHPQHQADVMVRRVGALPQPAVPAYTAVDAHWSWQLSERMDLSLTVQNLFDPSHFETGAATGAAYIDRRVLARLAWRQ